MYTSRCLISLYSDDGIIDAERQLIDCYLSSNIKISSLDELYTAIPMSAFKQNCLSAIASNLLPTSNAFYHHRVRAARQIQIWYFTLKSDMIIESIQNSDGFETDYHQVRLK